MKFLLKEIDLNGFHLHQPVELGRHGQPTPLQNNSPAPARNFRFVLAVQLLLEFFQDTDSIIT